MSRERHGWTGICCGCARSSVRGRSSCTWCCTCCGLAPVRTEAAHCGLNSVRDVRHRRDSAYAVAALAGALAGVGLVVGYVFTFCIVLSLGSFCLYYDGGVHEQVAGGGLDTASPHDRVLASRLDWWTARTALPDGEPKGTIYAELHKMSNDGWSKRLFRLPKTWRWALQMYGSSLVLCVAACGVGTHAVHCKALCAEPEHVFQQVSISENPVPATRKPRAVRARSNLHSRPTSTAQPSGRSRLRPMFNSRNTVGHHHRASIIGS